MSGGGCCSSPSARPQVQFLHARRDPSLLTSQSSPEDGEVILRHPGAGKREANEEGEKGDSNRNETNARGGAVEALVRSSASSSSSPLSASKSSSSKSSPDRVQTSAAGSAFGAGAGAGLAFLAKLSFSCWAAPISYDGFFPND